MTEHQIFVCVNRRPPSHREGCCEARGGPELLAGLQALVADQGLESRITVKASGCLDRCPDGPVVMIYDGQSLKAPPNKLQRLFVRGTAYGRLTPFDLPGLLEAHCVQGRPLDRCRI